MDGITVAIECCRTSTKVQQSNQCTYTVKSNWQESTVGDAM